MIFYLSAPPIFDGLRPPWIIIMAHKSAFNIYIYSASPTAFSDLPFLCLFVLQVQQYRLEQLSLNVSRDFFAYQ